MPDPSLSPAIIEARAICPTNVFEIETLEIRHPDVLVTKNTLELCFVVDKYSATGGYTTVAERVLAQVTAINSDLLQKYRRIKWALVTIEGASWEFDTGEYFVNFTQFLEAVATVNFSAIATHGQIYEPIKEIVSDLNWSVGNPIVARHIVYIGDTPNLTSTRVLDTATSDVMSVINGSDPYSFLLMALSGEYLSGGDLTGELVTVNGFANATNNGQFLVHSWFDSAFSRVLRFDKTITPFPNITETIGATVTASYYYTVTSADTPTLAIAALNAAGIIFNRLPTFTNANLTSMVTSTGGVSLSYAQLATPELVRTNVVNSLFTVEIIDSELESIFLVNDTRPHSLPIETGATANFETRGFKLRFAGSGENGLQNLSITIDDIDRKVSQFVARAKTFNTPIELVFRVYLSDDLSQQQNNPPTILYLGSTSSSSEGFSASATTLDVVNSPFPNAYYKLENFPLA